jgi:hypothetical protein
MKLTRLLVLPVAVCMSACAFNALNEGLPRLINEPVERAVEVLGLPNQRMDMGSFSVYVWDTSYSATIPVYQTSTSTTTGTVGTVPVYGTTTTGRTNYVPVQYQCQIKLQVDSFNIVKRWEYFGNQGGCQRYVGGLKQLVR